LCGYNLNLTYPQAGGYFPVLKNGFEDAALAEFKSRREMLGRFQSLVKQISTTKAQAQIPRQLFPPASYALDRRALQTRSDVALDPYLKCAILSELWLYAVNFTAPWSKCL
jgi:carboxypeptidase D